jgi:hypothetical protein
MQAYDFVSAMLQMKQRRRPAAAEALLHPVLWPAARREEFLVAVSEAVQVAFPRCK